MLHEIHQQSYILPDMSQLNPKYFWIWLTSLENTLIIIFKLEVNIFSILFNFRTNGISHITFFDIWCRKNITLQKKYEKVCSKVAQTRDLQIWRPVCWPLSYSATTYNLAKTFLNILFSVKWGNISFLSKMSADFINYYGFAFGFSWGTNDFYKVSMEH